MKNNFYYNIKKSIENRAAGIDWRLYIGLNDKNTKKQLIRDRAALDLIDKTITAAGLDSTYTAARGSYTHEDGLRINEKTIVAMIHGARLDTIKNLCAALCDKLNQECILAKNAKNRAWFLAA